MEEELVCRDCELGFEKGEIIVILPDCVCHLGCLRSLLEMSAAEELEEALRDTVVIATGGVGSGVTLET